MKAEIQIARNGGRWEDVPNVDGDEHLLPAMSGLDFLKWLRASSCKEIPIIIRRSAATQQAINIAYGANAYHVQAAGTDAPAAGS